MNHWLHEYPIPQMKRESFFSLNGEWILNHNTIEIPFSPQSELSLYHGEIGDELKYKKNFVLPDNFYNEEKRVYLHFGAVDQICKVYLNHSYIGSHEGGYLPFAFDVTDVLQDNNELIVEVIDTLSHDYPYGKQRKKRGGMWYTPVSGIWQTVWMEAVSIDGIKDIKITPSLSSIHLEVETDALEYTVSINEFYKQTFTQKNIDIEIPQESIHLWDVDDPYLYSLIIDTHNDHIESYFALRTIEIKDQKIYLNQKPIFLNGVLDQGYFMDGLYLPNHPDEYKNDVIRMKELGFNILRKHIKIEPETFYWACDKYGMLVMQDMVNNGGYNWLLDTALPNIGLQSRPDHHASTPQQRDIFKKHMIETLNHLYNHPCIISYTIFNEGWGQFQADQMFEICKSKDSTRFYDATSGWFHQKLSDVDSLHVYFKNKVLKTKMNKPILLSECGGYTRPIEGHMYKEDQHYGYGTTQSEEELTDKIVEMYEQMVIPSLKNGLCGVIYTQLSDVED